jgi:hypothetical protein
VWIDDVFICDASVEGLVAFRRLLEANHLDMDDKLNDAGIGVAYRRPLSWAARNVSRVCSFPTVPEPVMALE